MELTNNDFIEFVISSNLYLRFISKKSVIIIINSSECQCLFMTWVIQRTCPIGTWLILTVTWRPQISEIKKHVTTFYHTIWIYSGCGGIPIFPILKFCFSIPISPMLPYKEMSINHPRFFYIPPSLKSCVQLKVRL